MGDLTVGPRAWPQQPGPAIRHGRRDSCRGGSHRRLLHGSGDKLLHHGRTALDDTHLALGFGDLEFGNIRLETRSMRVLSFRKSMELQRLETEWGRIYPNFGLFHRNNPKNPLSCRGPGLPRS